MGFASQIPVFLFAPLGGILADRSNRKHVVIATQVASMLLAFVLAALTLSNRITVPEIFVLAALLGVVNAFDIPGRQSFLVDMVGKEDLMNAIALNSSMFNGARVIGPAVAGMLVAQAGRRLVLFRKRRELHRGDCGIDDDERACSGAGFCADVAVGAHAGGIPVREQDGADSRVDVAAGIGERYRACRTWC